MGLKRLQSCVGSNLSSVSWTCFHFELSASNCSLEILDKTKQKITTIGCLRLIQNICVFKNELVLIEKMETYKYLILCIVLIFWLFEAIPWNTKYSVSYIQKASDSSDQKPQFFWIFHKKFTWERGKLLKSMRTFLSFPNTAQPLIKLK